MRATLCVLYHDRQINVVIDVANENRTIRRAILEAMRTITHIEAKEAERASQEANGD